MLKGTKFESTLSVKGGTGDPAKRFNLTEMNLYHCFKRENPGEPVFTREGRIESYQA